MSLLVIPAPPAAAAAAPTETPVVFAPAELAPSRVAAERAARTLNRRVAPPAVAVAVKPAVKVKTVVKKPAVKTVKVTVKPAVKKTTPKPAPKVEAIAASGSVAEVIRYLQSKVGARYVWGAEGPSQFDCSGLSRAAYLRIGISLPHQSGAQARAGRAVSRSQLRAGDLVVYNGHVGVAVSSTMMIHAANPSKGVVRSSIYGNPIGYRRIVG